MESGPGGTDWFGLGEKSPLKKNETGVRNPIMIVLNWSFYKSTWAHCRIIIKRNNLVENHLQMKSHKFKIGTYDKFIKT